MGNEVSGENVSRDGVDHQINGGSQILTARTRREGGVVIVIEQPIIPDIASQTNFVGQFTQSGRSPCIIKQFPSPPIFIDPGTFHSSTYFELLLSRASDTEFDSRIQQQDIGVVRVPISKLLAYPNRHFKLWLGLWQISSDDAEDISFISSQSANGGLSPSSSGREEKAVYPSSTLAASSTRTVTTRSFNRSLALARSAHHWKVCISVCSLGQLPVLPEPPRVSPNSSGRGKIQFIGPGTSYPHVGDAEDPHNPLKEPDLKVFNEHSDVIRDLHDQFRQLKLENREHHMEKLEAKLALAEIGKTHGDISQVKETCRYQELGYAPTAAPTRETSPITAKQAMAALIVGQKTGSSCLVFTKEQLFKNKVLQLWKCSRTFDLAETWIRDLKVDILKCEARYQLLLDLFANQRVFIAWRVTTISENEIDCLKREMNDNNSYQTEMKLLKDQDMAKELAIQRLINEMDSLKEQNHAKKLAMQRLKEKIFQLENTQDFTGKLQVFSAWLRWQVEEQRDVAEKSLKEREDLDKDLALENRLAQEQCRTRLKGTMQKAVTNLTVYRDRRLCRESFAAWYQLLQSLQTEMKISQYEKDVSKYRMGQISSIHQAMAMLNSFHCSALVKEMVRGWQALIEREALQQRMVEELDRESIKCRMLQIEQEVSLHRFTSMISHAHCVGLMRELLVAWSMVVQEGLHFQRIKDLQVKTMEVRVQMAGMGRQTAAAFAVAKNMSLLEKVVVSWQLELFLERKEQEKSVLDLEFQNVSKEQQRLKDELQRYMAREEQFEREEGRLKEEIAATKDELQSYMAREEQFEREEGRLKEEIAATKDELQRYMAREEQFEREEGRLKEEVMHYQLKHASMTVSALASLAKAQILVFVQEVVTLWHRIMVQMRTERNEECWQREREEECRQREQEEELLKQEVQIWESKAESLQRQLEAEKEHSAEQEAICNARIMGLEEDVLRLQEEVLRHKLKHGGMAAYAIESLASSQTNVLVKEIMTMWCKLSTKSTHEKSVESYKKKVVQHEAKRESVVRYASSTLICAHATAKVKMVIIAWWQILNLLKLEREEEQARQLAEMEHKERAAYLKKKLIDEVIKMRQFVETMNTKLLVSQCMNAWMILSKQGDALEIRRGRAILVLLKHLMQNYHMMQIRAVFQEMAKVHKKKEVPRHVFETLFPKLGFNTKIKCERDTLNCCWNLFDADGGGTISISELADVLEDPMKLVHQVKDDSFNRTLAGRPIRRSSVSPLRTTPNSDIAEKPGPPKPNVRELREAPPPVPARVPSQPGAMPPRAPTPLRPRVPSPPRAPSPPTDSVSSLSGSSKSTPAPSPAMSTGRLSRPELSQAKHTPTPTPPKRVASPPKSVASNTQLDSGRELSRPELSHAKPTPTPTPPKRAASNTQLGIIDRATTQTALASRSRNQPMTAASRPAPKKPATSIRPVMASSYNRWDGGLQHTM